MWKVEYYDKSKLAHRSITFDSLEYLYTFIDILSSCDNLVFLNYNKI